MERKVIRKSTLTSFLFRRAGFFQVFLAMLGAGLAAAPAGAGMEQTMNAQKDIGHSSVPAIDRLAPEKTETALFALG